VKKKKLRTEVPVKATTAGMSSAALAAAVENEFSMALQDKVMEETKEKKNAVEEYVYSMRNKLYDSLVRTCLVMSPHAACSAWVACIRYDGAVWVAAGTCGIIPSKGRVCVGE
jgi:hypothetical protein